MALSPAEIKRADIQSFRDVATALDGMATANNDMKTGVGRLPIAGDAWKGVSGDAAHHELDRFGKLLSGSAESKTAAAAKIRRAADEFEGVKQLLAKIEKDAANGGFTIDMATGKVTPPQGDYDKNELSYIQNTLRQLQQAGDAANADLAAAVKAAKEPPAGAGPSGALPTTPNSAVKPDGVFGGVQNLATANPDGEPGATKAAATAAGADTQANYKEWYPKTPGAGDKLTIDPSKAGSLTGTVGALDKMPGAPKPQDGFGSGVAKQFLKGANDRIDGTIDEVKSKAGLNGVDKFAESWTNSAKGLEHQIERTLFPGAAMAEDAKNMIDQAVTSYQHPEKIPENIGKTTVDGAIIGATAPLGGEGALGRLGVEESAAARGALPDSPGMLHDLPGGHLFDGPPHPHVDAPSGGHSSGEIGPFTGEHSGTLGDHGGASHAPDLNHVSTESGGPGGWNQELNKPAPNTHYNVDDRFHYNTDNNSRVGHAHADLDASSAAERNGYQQRIAGGPDRLPGDQGGHIFGSQFGGPGEAINLTAMRDTLNSVGNREYYNLENDWRSYINEGKKVSVDVEITYPGDSRRPEMYSVRTYVDGNLDSVHSFRN
ncbi:DNA/RNA non-specific endonuclease [Mycobacteroides abscessus]|uniref:DNA/RNA non-specific endonuclease n=1 Tax=Mycobacteroides abscessus TaxID=36809 RepID=UPI000C25E08B|nr:DNA/RNA non-specific endonuclease [Mycobacteroides abscessus]RIR18131.1 endonuclease [Mycobacteroides abscessus]RIS08498.1 endonuclease [Mycobacteroides abscessus]